MIYAAHAFCPFNPDEQVCRIPIELQNEEQPSESQDKVAGLHVTFIGRGDLVAEIIRDRSVPAVFHCIIQHSTEVVFWGQYRSEKEAAEEAEAQLAYLSLPEQAA